MWSPYSSSTPGCEYYCRECVMGVIKNEEFEEKSQYSGKMVRSPLIESEKMVEKIATKTPRFCPYCKEQLQV